MKREEAMLDDIKKRLPFPLSLGVDKPKLSIIIPVYNVEPYLERCLQSVANQTLDMSFYEVIIIDDKSTDGSLLIAEKFCEKYKNFKLIKLPHQTIGGAGIPSNIGMEEARGDYLGFVDSDDFVAPYMFEEILKEALITEADIVVSDFTLFDNCKGVYSRSYDAHKFKLFCNSVRKGLTVDFQRKALLALSPVPWRKLYRRAFIQEHSIKYPEGDFFFEDNPLHWASAVLANKLAYVDQTLIFHRVGRPGQTTTSSDAKRFLSFVVHAETIKNFLNWKALMGQYRNEYILWLLEQSNWVIPKLGVFRDLYINQIQITIKNLSFNPFQTQITLSRFGYLKAIYFYLMYAGWENFSPLMPSLYQKFKDLKRLSTAFQSKILNKLLKIH